MTGDGSSQIVVLCVDDEPRMVNLIELHLERINNDISVLTETDPEDALETIDDEDLDCVVSDYDMPRMDGIALLEQVSEEHPDLPFIMLTGYGSEKVREEAESTGVTEYMEKDFGTEQFEVLAQCITAAVCSANA